MKNIKILIFAAILGLSLLSCKSSRIVDRPIDFEQDRIDLTLEYMNERYGLDRDSPAIKPKMIVLHWTAIPTLEGSFNAFKRSQLPQSREAISGASQLNVSSHFLVDRDGTIYRLMPETTMARHVIGLNHVAIGVENVGGTNDTPLTDAQLKANIWLVNYLSDKYDIEYLIGHYEYTNFEGHELWLEKDAGYRTEKTDPGTEFMKKVREATKNRNFKEVPSK
ncbi:N-acetylmuramoyl-L-alanine amidase [Christiangramia gaetbulicola]|uniref:N-acetylmuramoyl-L-alanine amidase n=1 Tax=Christiangramia gaetbulicola TaxID=703340 RepID=A0A2T6AE24_9FLAO|nr:peptidoglycan recognition family protein [Christiangramia gaetbulicola]PTX42060.1 N-acetylmuramoyl-L-alanine amidase [Christiangramia gaetbulicola]